MKQINAGVLNIGYVEAGPADGRPVILLHGFPYDIHSFVEVAPLLAAQNYRVIVPYMRGHGTNPVNNLEPAIPSLESASWSSLSITTAGGSTWYQATLNTPLSRRN